MIDQLGSDNQFFVLTDCGGFFGWTSFDSWEATDEPDVVLQPEYIAMRTQELYDDIGSSSPPTISTTVSPLPNNSAIKAFPSKSSTP